MLVFCDIKEGKLWGEQNRIWSVFHNSISALRELAITELQLRYWGRVTTDSPVNGSGIDLE